MTDRFSSPAPALIPAITEFIFVREEPWKADLLFLPGSHAEEHVRYAAQLYHSGYTSRILPSGRFPIGTDAFSDPAFPTEWAWMQSLLMRLGVPEDAILREDRATYTWQNAQFSRQVTDALGWKVERAILCCKPYHARRALFYYQTAFPETLFRVCPASIPGRNADDWYRTAEGRACVLGEVRRLGSQINEVLEQAVADRIG